MGKPYHLLTFADVLDDCGGAHIQLKRRGAAVAHNISLVGRAEGA